MQQNIIHQFHKEVSKVCVERNRILLSENNYITNEIKNCILPIDTPDKLCRGQKFSGGEFFSFSAQEVSNPLDVNEHIDQFIIVKDL